MNTLSGELSAFVSAFHFLRPLWLLFLPLILIVWWWLRRPGDKALHTRFAHIAPHLARALSVGERHKRHWPVFLPIDSLALLLTLLALATAGPAWTRLPDPLMARTAPLVVVMQVNQSMTEKDVAPSRLERAKQKVYDLLERRDGAPTALIAYAGTAHRVVPLTEDQNLLRPYVEGLAADVMPREGNNAAGALELAEQVLKSAQMPGGILFLTDGIESRELDAFNQRDRNNGLGLLILLPGNARIPGAGQVSAAKVSRVTPDRRDIDGFVRYFDRSFKQTLARDKNLQWNDRGWWLAWPAALLALLWFRRGWALQQSGHAHAQSRTQSRTAHRASTVVLMLLAGSIAADFSHPRARAQSPTSAVADKDIPPENAFLSRLFTPDQLGQWRMGRKEYARAANAFVDPYRRGYAQYQAGHYQDAANTLATLTRPEAVFTRAMAQVKSGQYQDAIAGFKQVLRMDATFPGAQKNLQLAQEILAYIQKSRGDEDEKEQQTDSDDDSYDKQQQKEVQSPQTPGNEAPVNPEQWMSTLDTSTGEFMKQRFAAEVAAGQAGGDVP
ncbi:VWA domain-containing protein [Microbulbifer salipaludis]|uniref:VWA domain-containing protein n=1 Tax=Microbulbifer salipaludis TaxID=187980 RepID=A0ABS3E9R8_9GAMM|nr:VWA domain-containing protein [Microbulbifer salipaludis]